MELGDETEAAEVAQMRDGVGWRCGSGDRESRQVALGFGGRANQTGWCMRCGEQERKRPQAVKVPEFL